MPMSIRPHLAPVRLHKPKVTIEEDRKDNLQTPRTPEVLAPPQSEIITVDEPAPAETFRAVFDEFMANVPDRTSTIEEKELAIQYIDRLLACPDIPNPEYWEAKKVEIQKEIESIKQSNTNNETSGDTANTVWKEFQEYYDNNQPPNSDPTAWHEFNKSCLEYFERGLACADINEPKNARIKDEFIALKTMYEQAIAEYEGQKGDTFDAVLKEARESVALPAQTLENKELAIKYIDRLLACPDIPESEYQHYETLKAILEQEIIGLKNEDKIGNGQNAATIWHEFSQFAEKYLHSQDFTSAEWNNNKQRDEYLKAYHDACITFYARLVNSSDATDEMITTWFAEMKNHERASKELELVIQKKYEALLEQ